MGNQTSVTSGEYRFAGTKSGQMKTNHVFFVRRLLFCSIRWHGVSDFQQNVWSNLSRSSGGQDGEMWWLELWQIVLPKDCWLMDWYWPQTSLTNIFINNPDYLKSQRHSHCPSPGTYLCQSHPHIRTTHSPGHAFFCHWYLTHVILQPGTLFPFSLLHLEITSWGSFP